MNAEAAGLMVSVMTVLTFAWGAYKVVIEAANVKLIRFIALALVGLLLMDAYILIVLSSR